MREEKDSIKTRWTATKTAIPYAIGKGGRGKDEGHIQYAAISKKGIETNRKQEERAYRKRP